MTMILLNLRIKEGYPRIELPAASRVWTYFGIMDALHSAAQPRQPLSYAQHALTLIVAVAFSMSAAVKYLAE